MLLAMLAVLWRPLINAPSSGLAAFARSMLLVGMTPACFAILPIELAACNVGLLDAWAAFVNRSIPGLALVDALPVLEAAPESTCPATVFSRSDACIGVVSKSPRMIMSE